MCLFPAMFSHTKHHMLMCSNIFQVFRSLTIEYVCVCERVCEHPSVSCLADNTLASWRNRDVMDFLKVLLFVCLSARVCWAWCLLSRQRWHKTAEACATFPIRMGVRTSPSDIRTDTIELRPTMSMLSICWCILVNWYGWNIVQFRGWSWSLFGGGAIRT